MAVVQITRIQHRRGMSGELPDALADAEIGMTTDTGEVFIGAPNHPSVSGRETYPYGNIKILTELDVQYGIRGDVYYHGPLQGGVINPSGAGVFTPVICLFKKGQREFGNLDFSLTGSAGAVRVMGAIFFALGASPELSSVKATNLASVGWNGSSLTDSFRLSGLNPVGQDDGHVWLSFNNTNSMPLTLGVSGREWSTPIVS